MGGYVRLVLRGKEVIRRRGGEAHLKSCFDSFLVNVRKVYAEEIPLSKQFITYEELYENDGVCITLQYAVLNIKVNKYVFVE